MLATVYVDASQNVRLEQVSLEEGLSQANVSQILQDSDGFLWFGTSQGLNFYDGHSIRIVSGPDNLLEIQAINTLFEDSKNNIWVGSVPNKNFRIRKSDSSIQEFIPPFPKDREVLDSAFMTVAQGTKEQVWMATMRAIFKYDSVSEQLDFVVDFEPTLDNRNLIRAIYEYGEWLLVGTSSGAFAYHVKENRIQSLPFLTLHSKTTVTNRSTDDDRENVKNIHRNNTGDFLFLTVEGLYSISTKTLDTFLDKPIEQLESKVLVTDLNVWQIIEEKNFYWLATHQGLIKLTKNGQLEPVVAYSETRYQSVDNNIIAMIKDNEGNFWFGSRNDGAFKWNPNVENIGFYQKNQNNSRAISDNLVWATKEDNEGNIWVGTKNGLNRIDAQTGDVRQFLINGDIKATVTASTIYDIEVQGDLLWILSSEGITKFDTKSLKRIEVEATEQGKHKLPEYPRDIFFLNEKNMGILNADGLHIYNTETGAVTLNENTNSKGNVLEQFGRMIGGSPNNNDQLYFSMVDRVATYSKSSGTYQTLHSLPPSDTPRTYAEGIYNDGEKTWISYPGFGIYVVDNASGEELKHFTSLDGLPDNSQFQFSPDRRGNLWVTSNSGLIRFNTQTLHFRIYDMNDGLATNEFNGGAALVTKKGELYLGSIKGVMKVDPLALLSQSGKRDLSNHITKISLMSREFPESFSPFVDHKLELSHEDYGLRLSFSALSYSNPKKLKYKYWLEGSSRTKPTITRESDLFLPKLEPGNSIFKVSVVDYETGEESAPASLYLSVNPHPAFSKLAYSLYILFFATISFVIFWQRRKRHIIQVQGHRELKSSEQRLKLALQGSNSGLWDWQSEKDIVYEPRLRKRNNQQGYFLTFEERLQSIHEQEKERYRLAWLEFLGNPENGFEFVYRMAKKDGNWAWFRDLARVTEYDQRGYAQRVTGTFTDISKSKEDDDKIILFSQAFQNTRDMVVITGRQLVVSAANSSLYKMTSFVEDKTIGSPLHFLQSSKSEKKQELDSSQKQSLTDVILSAMNESGHWEGEGYLTRLYRKPLPVLISVNAFSNEQKEERYVFAITDIEEQKNAEQELRKLANYDTLTNLPNRALLMDRITHAVEKSRRNKRRIALFFIDLDRFKQVNDSLGHDVGDQLLVNVAKILKHCTRRNDTVSRLGGDEFVVMLEEIENLEVISRIAQAMQQKMLEPLQLGNNEISVSSSIGISIYPEDGYSADELLKHADIAMYHAKNLGRNNFQYFTDEMNSNARERLIKENEIRTAIRNNEFILHFQPKVCLQSHKIESFELLARWQKSDGSLVPPFEFIPLAEELGLIIEMTEQFIVQALGTLKAWRAIGISTSFALNLSAKHLHHYDLSQFVAKQLKDFDVPASCLEFELTESTIMQNLDGAVALLEHLHGQGVRLSLDDFGTGYTSFQYLKDFPIDALKIDRSFVKDIGKEPKDEAIIDSIITLASKLGIQTIAEGVETQEQAKYLRDRGCPLTQGYLYSKPVPVEQALQLIKKGTIDI